MNDDVRYDDVKSEKQRVALRALTNAGMTRGGTNIPQAALPHWRLTMIDGSEVNVFPSGAVRPHTGA